MIIQKIYKEVLLLSDEQLSEIKELLDVDLREQDFSGIGTSKLWDIQSRQIKSCFKVEFNHKVYVRYYVFLDADQKSHVRLWLCRTKSGGIFGGAEERIGEIKTNYPLGKFCFRAEKITYILTVKTKDSNIGNVYKIGV